MSGRENRRAKRRNATSVMDVVDYLTNKKVGHLINLSETGMLMMANQALTPEGLYQFDIALHRDGDGQPHAPSVTIRVGAQELWSEEANAPGQRWTGFRFIDISPADLLQVRHWVDLPYNPTEREAAT